MPLSLTRFALSVLSRCRPTWPRLARPARTPSRTPETGTPPWGISGMSAGRGRTMSSGAGAFSRGLLALGEQFRPPRCLRGARRRRSRGARRDRRPGAHEERESRRGRGSGGRALEHLGRRARSARRASSWWAERLHGAGWAGSSASREDGGGSLAGRASAIGMWTTPDGEASCGAMRASDARAGKRVAVATRHALLTRGAAPTSDADDGGHLSCGAKGARDADRAEGRGGQAFSSVRVDGSNQWAFGARIRMFVGARRAGKSERPSEEFGASRQTRPQLALASTRVSILAVTLGRRGTMATASAPGAAPAVATDSARLVVDMKRELMDMVRAAQYESALAVCERRASRAFVPFSSPRAPRTRAPNHPSRPR